MEIVEFKDYPNTDTPLNAYNLNRMQNNIKTELTNIEQEGIIVSPTEPTTNRRKVWIQNVDNNKKIHVLNDNNVYEEFIKKHEEINNVNTKLDISKVINFTPQNAINYQNYGNSYYYKIGSRVHIHFGILCNNSSNTVIFTMPEGFRPRSSISSLGYGEDFNKYGIIVIDYTGTVRCLSSTKYLNVDVEYDVIG